MPNRRRPPRTYPIRSLPLPEVDVYRLDNGLPVYVISDRKQEVVKLEWVFRAGRPYEVQSLVARQTQLMMRAGSQRYTREEIAEQLDFLGSSLSLPFHLDTAPVEVYSLHKHLPEMLPLLADLLQQPIFPATELAQLLQRQQAQLEVELEKIDVVAYRQITEILFGESHPYGYNSTRQGLQEVQREHLVAHHERCYHAGNAQLFVGGHIGEADIDLLNQYFGQQPAEAPVPVTAFPGLPETGHQPQHVVAGNGLQHAIRLGRRLFDRRHPDYPGLYVLNTILGGYFGSRLMTNIREEKGWTYNIQSSLDMMHYHGAWIIGCEIAAEHAPAAVAEIREEMERLCRQPVPEKELEMVRNYLMGTLLTLLDGPLQSMDLVLTLQTEGLPEAFFARWVDTILHISAGELQALAQRYLRPDDWATLIVTGRPGGFLSE